MLGINMSHIYGINELYRNAYTICLMDAQTEWKDAAKYPRKKKKKIRKECEQEINLCCSLLDFDPIEELCRIKLKK